MLSSGIQEFLDDVDSRVHKARRLTKNWPIVDNAEQQAAMLLLRQDPTVIVCETDKNEGLMAMDVGDYEALRRQCLAASAEEVTAATLGCDAGVVEQTIVADVRTKLAEVLEKHDKLIQSWKGGALD